MGFVLWINIHIWNLYIWHFNKYKCPIRYDSPADKALMWVFNKTASSKWEWDGVAKVLANGDWES